MQSFPTGITGQGRVEGMRGGHLPQSPTPIAPDCSGCIQSYSEHLQRWRFHIWGLLLQYVITLLVKKAKAKTSQLPNSWQKLFYSFAAISHKSPSMVCFQLLLLFSFADPYSYPGKTELSPLVHNSPVTDDFSDSNHNHLPLHVPSSRLRSLTWPLPG